jgi:hypothetical protein
MARKPWPCVSHGFTRSTGGDFRLLSSRLRSRSAGKATSLAKNTKNPMKAKWNRFKEHPISDAAATAYTPRSGTDNKKPAGFPAGSEF